MNTLLTSRDDIFRPIEERFNRLFDTFFGSESQNAVRSLSKSGYPKVDVLTKDGQFRVEAALPGVRLDQLRVEILPWSDQSLSQRKVLKISGKMDYEYQYPENTAYQIKELSRSRFERTILLPSNLEGDPMALLENGILRLTWPATVEPKSEAKLIPIQEIKS